MEKQTKNLIVRISLLEREMSSAIRLAEEKGITRLPDLFRYLLTTKIEELDREIGKRNPAPRVAAPSRIAKNERENAFDAFKQMDAEEMTAELIRINYIVPGSIEGLTETVELVDGNLFFVSTQGSSSGRNPIENLYGEIEKAYKKFYAPK